MRLLIKIRLKKLFQQFIKFFGISGIGWCIDFSLYVILTSQLKCPVFFSNCLSSIPAITLVFFVSTRKIFKSSNTRWSIGAKYFIYICYQAALLFCVSALGQFFAESVSVIFINIALVKKLSKTIAKIMITPITMCANFFVLKMLTEKV